MMIQLIDTAGQSRGWICYGHDELGWFFVFAEVN